MEKRWTETGTKEKSRKDKDTRKKKRNRKSEDEAGEYSSEEATQRRRGRKRDDATEHDSESSEVYYMSRVCIFGYAKIISVGGGEVNLIFEEIVFSCPRIPVARPAHPA